MPNSGSPTSRQGFAAVIIACAVLAFFCKLLLAWHSFGTNDMLFFQNYWRKSLQPGGGIGLYREGIDLVEGGRVWWHEEYMHPPFVIHLLRLVGWFSQNSGLAFPFLMRLPSLLADAGIVYLLWTLLRPQNWSQALALALVAASPVSALVSGFHGNTDALVVFFLLLSLKWAAHKESPLWAGAAFGMSVNIKVWPLLLAPAVLAWLKDWRGRFAFSCGSAATVLLGATPFLWQDPALIIRRVLGYSSLHGIWGLSRMLNWLEAATGWGLPNAVFRATGKYLVAAMLAWIGIWLARRAPLSPLPVRIGFLAALFLVVTPGFGPQYLAWVAPWGAFAGPQVLLLFNFSGLLFLYSVYSYWGGAFPWHFANSLSQGTWTGMTIFYEVLVWSAIAALAFVLWRQLQRAWGSPQQATPPAVSSRRPSASKMRGRRRLPK